jgi:hypothetical protein
MWCEQITISNQSRQKLHELFLGYKLNLQDLRIIGCVVHTLILDLTMKIIDPKSKLCWLVHYDTHIKTDILFNPRTKKVLLQFVGIYKLFNPRTKKDVTFDKTQKGQKGNLTYKGSCILMSLNHMKTINISNKTSRFILLMLN